MANQERLAARGGPNLFEKEDAAICDRRPTVGKSFDNTRAFLSELMAPVRVLAAVEVVDPKDYFPPIPKKDSDRLAKERYYRRLEIASRYTSGYTETLDEVAERFGISKQRVGQIFTRMLDDLWQSAPDALKQKYPRQTLDTDKHHSIHYGLRGEVVTALESGEDVKALTARLGPYKMSKVRNTSHRFERKIPYVQEPLYQRFAGLKNPDATSQQIQELLDEVENHSQYPVLLKAGFIINLSQVARLAGLYPNFSDILSIYNKLRAEELSARRLAHKMKEKDGRETVHYYNFIAKKDLDKAADILSQAPEFTRLKQNPIAQVSGPDGKIPKTTELRLLRNYDHVGNLILEISGKRLSPNSIVKSADIIGNSPVPIYKWLKRGKVYTSSGLYYPNSQKEELRAHLTLRLRELGLI